MQVDPQEFLLKSHLPLVFQVQLGGEIRLGQTLPGPGLLRPRAHGHLLQRDGGGGAQLYLEELQVPSVPGTAAEARQLPEHHHHLPETRQEHLPHHAQLQPRGLPPLVRLHGATGIQRGLQSLYHLHGRPVGSCDSCHEDKELRKTYEARLEEPSSHPGGNAGKWWRISDCLAREEQRAGLHFYAFLISECMESLQFKELADKNLPPPKSVFNDLMIHAGLIRQIPPQEEKHGPLVRNLTSFELVWST